MSATMTEATNSDDHDQDDMPLNEAAEREDLPTRTDSSLRVSIDRKKSLLRDVLGAVVRGDLSSVQITGAPGIGKSRLCQQFLEAQQVEYVECTGVLTTPMAVKKLQDNPDKVFLLDDCFGCSGDPKFHHVLLEALGSADQSSGVRQVHYETRLGTQVFDFSGRFIVVSNGPFAGAKRGVLAALESRLVVHNFFLTDAEIESEIYMIAESGFDTVDRQDAITVATRLLRECRTAQVTPSIRLYVDQAIPLFSAWKRGQMARSWQEHVVTLVRRGRSLAIRVGSDSRAEQEAFQMQTLIQVLAEHQNRAEQIQAWRARTGRSQASFYRALTRLTNGEGLGPEAA